jgi:hypothetical protein
MSRYALFQTYSAPSCDAYFEYVQLLLNMDGADGSTTFTDLSPYGTTATVWGDAQIDTAQSRFGSASGLFDGTGDSLTLSAGERFNLSVSDFTIEFWMRPNSVAATQTIVDMMRSALVARGLIIAQPGSDQTKLRFAVGDSDIGDWNASIISTTSLTTGTWYHVAAVRRGSVFELFLNGVSEGTATWSGIINYDVIAPRIGAAMDGSLGYNGHLDDLRITRGFARYTGAFTPPTRAAPTVACTPIDPTPLWSGSRGVFGGGQVGSSSNEAIDYVTIQTTGNTTDFGNLSTVRYGPAAASNRTRGVFAGGYRTTGATRDNTIDYVTVATVANAVDFGDLLAARTYPAGLSNGSRGVFAGGIESTSTNVNTIEFVTIGSTGNATDFGDLTTARWGCGAVSNSVRGVIGGGWTSAAVNTMDYISIASASNAASFGSLSAVRNGIAGVSNASRGLFCGGNATDVSNVIDYITVATTGNATDFGDLTAARQAPGGAADATRAVIAGGFTTAAAVVTDYFTMATTGNATAFGDLTPGRFWLAGLSGQ